MSKWLILHCPEEPQQLNSQGKQYLGPLLWKPLQVIPSGEGRDGALLILLLLSPARHRPLLDS